MGTYVIQANAIAFVSLTVEAKSEEEALAKAKASLDADDEVSSDWEVDLLMVDPNYELRTDVG